MVTKKLAKIIHFSFETLFFNALHRELGIPGLDDGIRETWPDKASVQRWP